MKKGFVTVKEAANVFAVSIQTIRRWDRKGKLKCFRHPMNNYRMFRLLELQEMVNKMQDL